jgi:hypothetical protein
VGLTEAEHQAQQQCAFGESGGHYRVPFAGIFKDVPFSNSNENLLSRDRHKRTESENLRTFVRSFAVRLATATAPAEGAPPLALRVNLRSLL